MTILRRALAPLDRLPATSSGRVLAIAAIIGFSVSGVLAKSIYDAGATPVSLLLIRFAAAAAVLALLSGRRLWSISRRTRLMLVGMGMFFAVQALAYYAAVSLAPVSLVVVTVAAYPLLVVLIDVLLRQSALDLPRLGLMAGALVGLWLAAGAPRSGLSVGMLLALACAVIYAVYLQASQRLFAGIPVLVSTFWVITGSLGVVALLTVVTVPAFPSPAGWALAAGHGVFTTALPIVALYAAVQRLGASGVAQIGIFEPVLAMGVAAVVLGERLTLVQVGGAALVVGAMICTAAIRPRAVLPRSAMGASARLEPARGGMRRVVHTGRRRAADVAHVAALAVVGGLGSGSERRRHADAGRAPVGQDDVLT